LSLLTGAAILEHTKRVIYLEDGQIAILKPESYQIINFDNKPINSKINNIDWSLEKIEKGKN